MGISDEIEVATIAIDLIKFDNVNRTMTAKKPALYVQFLFCFFSRFPHRCDCTELASCVTMQNNSCSAMISSHDEKTHNLMEKARQNRRPQVYLQRLTLT